MARAQESITLQADLIFYGDNTEFRNPFREGETIFGTAARGGLEIGLGERARLQVGVLANQRFGSESAFELVRPVVALTLKDRHSTFVFGTLPAATPGAPPGPDRTGPHGLLPPLQRETLAFDRPYEAGFQWTLASARVRHASWLNWQRLNTPEHRERFDAGVNAMVAVAGPVRLPLQFHLVHEGGQLFNAGPVADSVAVAAGAALTATAGAVQVDVDAHALAASYTPDREDPSRDRDGAAFFGRAAAQSGGWRSHLLFWRGRNFITSEGDPNYLSLRRDGRPRGGIRDYAEAGIARSFAPAAGVLLEASARIHRVERDYGYSYRVLATVDAGWRLR